MDPWRNQLVSVALLVVMVAECPAQDATQTPEAWFEDFWSAPVPDLSDVRVEYEVHWPARLSDEELRRLGQEVAGRPDHPERATLEEEHRRRAGDDVSVRTLWYLGPGRWRWNQDNDYVGDGSYTDRASDGANGAWVMIPGQANISDATGSDGFDPASNEPGLLKDFNDLLSCGLYSARGAGSQPVRFKESNGSWQVTLQADWGYTAEVTGRWQADAEVGEIDRLVITAHKNAEYVGLSKTSDNWRYEPLLDRWIATEVTEYEPTGEVSRRLVLRGVYPREHEVSELLQAPRFGRADVIRGEPTQTAIYDRRSRARRLTHRDEAGSLSDRDLGRGGSGGVLRVAGWILVGGLVATLVACRLWRKS